jgi:Na+-driven multidrug efflux pump
VHAIVATIAIRTTLSLVLAPIMAIEWGVQGAVWSMVISATVGGIITIYFGLLPRDIPFLGQRIPAMDGSVSLDVGAD